MRLKVVFRACDKVFCNHPVGRPFSNNKSAIIRVSFHSLLNTLANHDYEVHVIGDKLSPEITAFFESYPKVIVHHYEFKNGAAESITTALDQALKFDDEDWVYTCEDDYLHAPYFMQYLEDFVTHKDKFLSTKYFKRNRTALLTGNIAERPLFIFPPDYPDRYMPLHTIFSLLFISNYCHWRQVTKTTHTFIAQVKSLKQFEEQIRESGHRLDDAYLSRKVYGKYWLRNKAICLSPLPGLATHLTEDVMTPLVDWEAIFNKNLEQLKQLNKIVN